MNIQKIEYDKKERIETGVVQFGDDWPGVFIRGDDAHRLASLIDKTIEFVRPSRGPLFLLTTLRDLLRACEQGLGDLEIRKL